MKQHGFPFLMIAALLAVCDLQSDRTVRRFRYFGLQKNWTDARAFCRESFFDLATIQNLANQSEAQQVAGASRFWIGLFNGTWKWSLDESKTHPSSTLFTQWNSREQHGRQCVTISVLGFWSTNNCGELKEFVCYDASTNGNVLVRTKMSWPDAQSYCRSTHTDLSTIRDIPENTAVALLGLLTYSVAWIGLHRSHWVWSDGSLASFRAWNSQSSTNEANCVVMDSSSGVWERRPCGENNYFLCSADVERSAVRSLKVRLNPGSADLNDPAVQRSILEQLKQKLQDEGAAGEVKLSWRIQADGKVFHQEDKTAPPGVCVAETCAPP